MQPAVSVIIPTYNRAGFLKKSVQSVLNQTFQDFEMIIINNYSDDNTLEIVNSFNDNRIKMINFRNDGVIARSRNQGIMHSTGNYIAFLDDDDLWLPNKLELQVNYMHRHPEYFLIYSNAWIIDNTYQRKQLYLRRRTYPQGIVFNRLIKENFIPILTVLIKREIFRDIGFFNEAPSLKGVEDYEYWLRITLKYKIGFVNEPLAEYRVHSSMTSNELNVARLVQTVLLYVLNNFSVPSNNKILEKFYELYCYSALHNWKNSDKLYMKKDLKRYLIWAGKNLKIVSLLKMSLVFIPKFVNIFLLRQYKHIVTCNADTR